MLKSSCCKAELLKSSRTDLFHGADDDYDLRVPVLTCSKCGHQEMLVFSGEKLVNKSTNIAS
ncbi:hypothetical protein [Robertmurraya massiliosenegalensis]|uniref:hypothetical protein n=1 Tax=Robertmurraya massiliosenegalensis TaxID=1287657 RepID=UPI000379F84E|nr:hypothetical protein [Robertmurraya massiliosenegalensis]